MAQRHNYGSAVNQRIIEQLIDRESPRVESTLVEALLKASGMLTYAQVQELGFPNQDNMNMTREVVDENQFRFEILEDSDEHHDMGDIRIMLVTSTEEDHEGEEYDFIDGSKQQELRALWEERYDGEPDDKDIVELYLENKGLRAVNVLEEGDEPTTDTEDIDVLMWYGFSDWMLEKLEEKGEFILRCDVGDWWGRTCYGQSPVLDPVFGEIAEEMGILEGQGNSWAPKGEKSEE